MMENRSGSSRPRTGSIAGWTRSRWWVVGITLLAVLLRLTHLGSKSFWFDECFTYTATLAPLRNSLEALLVAGIYSPFYFLLLRPIVALGGTSEYAFRFLSAAFGSITVPVIYHLGRRLKSESTGLLAALLLAICPFHIWYSQDARMYAPMVFFGLAAMDRFVLVMRGRRKWISFALCSGLAYLMHYATFSLLYVQLVYLLPYLKRTRLVRRWFLAQIAAVAPLVPWLAFYLIRGIRPTGLAWIPRPGLFAPIKTLWNFATADAESFTPLVAVIAVGTALVFLSGLVVKLRERWLLIWWLALPIGSLYVLSFRRPYYVDRYLMASLPAYLLFLALGIVTQRERFGRLLAAAAVLSAMAWGTARLYTDPIFAKEGWRETVVAVETGLEEADLVVLQDQETLIGTSVYRTREWPNIVLGTEDITAILEGSAAEHERIWLIWRSPRESNHRLSKSEPFDIFSEASPPVRDWLAIHWQQVTLDLQLPGMSVVRIDVGSE